MSMMRYDPFRDLERWLEHQSKFPWNDSPIPMDAHRNEHLFKFDFDIPGVPLEAIDLTVEGNVLSVKVDRPLSPSEGEELMIAERPHGSLRRQVILDEPIDPEHVEAVFENGVLRVTIPIATAKNAHKIEVDRGQGKVIDVESSET